MDDVEIVPLTPSLAAQVEDWSGDSSNSLLRRLARNDTQDNEGWVALVGNKPVAIVKIDVDSSRTGVLDFTVKPSERRHGIGAHVVEYALSQPSIASLTRLRAVVEYDNTPAQKILSREGFSQVGYTPEGRLEFERHHQK
jgi:ribosomal protein S18 acetylase RimI-like enzyme